MPFGVVPGFCHISDTSSVMIMMFSIMTPCNDESHRIIHERKYS